MGGRTERTTGAPGPADDHRLNVDLLPHLDGPGGASHADEPRRLILVRPGQGIRRRHWAGTNEARPLSGKGRKQVARLGRFLASREVDVSTIACGPSIRDRETAELLAAWLGARVHMDGRISPGLTLPGLAALMDDLRARDPRGPEQRLLLVAQEPVVSLLLVLLTDSPGIDLDAGAAASLRLQGPVAPGCASLGWLVVPSMLRGLRLKARPRARPEDAPERDLVGVA